MKTIHQRVYPSTQIEAQKILTKINYERSQVGHKTMNMPELFDFLVEYYKENNNDNISR